MSVLCRGANAARSFCVATIVLTSSCRAPLGDLEMVLNRHADAVAAIPGEHRDRLTSSYEPTVSTTAEDLLPEDVLSSEVARAIAVRANPDVHTAVARLEGAAAQIDEARSAFLPTVVFAHNATRTFHTPASRNRLSTAIDPVATVPADLEAENPAITTLLNALRLPLFGRSTPEGDTNSFSEHATSFTVTWAVFDGFVRDARFLASKQLHEAHELALADTRRLIVEAVDTAYYQVQLAEEQFRISQADEEFGREQYEETRKLQAVGWATAADVDNFRVRVLAAQANVAGAVGLRETGRVMLAELMGIDGASLPPDLKLSELGDETDAEMEAPDPVPWLEQAHAERPDLRQLESLLEVEEQNVRAAKGRHLPTVTASGSWGFDRSSNLRYTVDDQSSAGAIEFRWDLYTGGRVQAQVRMAESSRAEAVARLNRLRLAVEAQVRRAIIDLVDTQEQIRLQRENLATALENRRIVRAGYGTRESLVRLNEAQRDVIRAEVNLALARIRLRQAWTDLRTAAGGGFPTETQP